MSTSIMMAASKMMRTMMILLMMILLIMMTMTTLRTISIFVLKKLRLWPNLFLNFLSSLQSITVGRRDRRRDGQRDGWMERWTDREMNGWTTAYKDERVRLKMYTYQREP